MSNGVKHNLTDSQLMLGGVLFLLLFSIDKKEHRGKRVRKKITMCIKKQLSMYRKTNPKRYLKLVNKSRDIIIEAKAKQDSHRHELGSEIIPTTILDVLKYRYSNLFDVFEIDDAYRSELYTIYEGGRLAYPSAVYTNIIVELIYDYLNGEHDDKKEL